MKKNPEATQLHTPAGLLCITIETITPEQATAYLARNENNRRLRPRLIEILKRDILADNYHFSHQGIAFDTENTLIDGQHRLSAIIASGKPVPMLVFRGLQRSSQEIIDLGQARSIAETLQIVDGVKNANLTCAYVNAICWQYATGKGFKVSLTQSRQILDLWPEIHTLVEIKNSYWSAPKAFRLTPVLSMVIPALKAWPKAAEFCEQYVSGLGLSAGSPANALRNHCVKLTSTTSGRGISWELSAYTADCMEAEATGREMPRGAPTGTGLAWLRGLDPDRYRKTKAICRDA